MGRKNKQGYVFMTFLLEAPTYQKYLLNKKEIDLMANYDELYELISKYSEDNSNVIEKIEEMSLRGLSEFYTQSVRMLSAGMSHEIKSPLQTLVGALEIIKDVANSDDDIDMLLLRECIEIASDARAKIDNIMNVMVLCGKDLNETDIKCLNFEDLMNDILSSLKYREEYKTSKIHMYLKMNIINKQFCTIPSFVYHMVTNIISNSCNAISLSKISNGIISITCSRGMRSDEINLDICDNGVGIKEDQFEKIFMPFYSHRLVKNSYGLGLFIARAMAHKMNGNIFVKESSLGKTVMRIILKDLKEGVI